MQASLLKGTAVTKLPACLQGSDRVHGEIHFDLDPNVTPEQCTPQNVQVALKV